MADIIQTRGLTKRYQEKTAVDGLSVSIPEGQLVALLGVNGAGKTTTIRMLTCLSKPTEGSASLFGHDVVKEADEVKRLVGISTQDTAVADNLTVRENLEFMAGIYLENDRIRKAVSDTMRAFSLEEYANKKAKHLSGGWKRKLSIAMAIIGEPRVLFLDEPTLGLDVLARRQLWKEIPAITPHVCRHTFCSKMAKAGMNPKTLQYIMGHADISVTLNTYTHVTFEDVREEMARLCVNE